MYAEEENLGEEFYTRFRSWARKAQDRASQLWPDLEDCDLVDMIFEEQLPEETAAIERKTMRTFDGVSPGAQIYLRARGEKWHFVVVHIWMVLFQTTGEPGDIQVNEDRVLTVESSGLTMWVDPQNVLRTIREKDQERKNEQ